LVSAAEVDIEALLAVLLRSALLRLLLLPFELVLVLEHGDVVIVGHVFGDVLDKLRDLPHDDPFI
jgi:hypothetical protein